MRAIYEMKSLRGWQTFHNRVMLRRVFFEEAFSELIEGHQKDTEQSHNRSVSFGQQIGYHLHCKYKKCLPQAKFSDFGRYNKGGTVLNYGK